MKKIILCILMVVAAITMASCSTESNEGMQPVGNGELQFVVSDLPAFGEAQTGTVAPLNMNVTHRQQATPMIVSLASTRNYSIQNCAIGTEDPGKTAWEDGDEIVVAFTSKHYGEQGAILTYDGSSGEWSTDVSFSYLEDETPIVNAIYVPCCEVADGKLQLKDGMQPGMTECIPAVCSFTNGVVSISFHNVTRDYSRLRIVGVAGQTYTVTTTDFTPAGANEAELSDYTLTADAKGNAYLYGTFAEGATVLVKQGDVTLAEYTFKEATEQGTSYVLDAHTHTYNAEGRCSICGERKVTTITFDTDGGSAVAPITQQCGTAVTAPANPTKANHTFVGWSPALPSTMPTEDITVKAIWQQTGYTIVWKRWDGSVLRTDYNVPAGTIPTYDTTPVKNHDDQYAYEFIGWTPAVVAVTGDATYTATYKAVPLSEYEYKVGDKVVASASEVKYCGGCGRLLKNYTATITGVRGVLDGKTVYWVKYECCGRKSSMIETEIIGLA